MKIQNWHSYLLTISVAILVALFFRFFIVSSYLLPTESMMPNLLPGDFIFALRNSFLWKHELQRGDLIIFSKGPEHKKLLARRVIGLPGDKIEISNGRLILNGQSFHYSSKELPPTASPSPIVRESLSDLDWEIVDSKFNKNLSENSSGHFGPVMVAENEFFVLADHRDHMEDSRTLGFVNASSIVGKIWAVWFSCGRLSSDNNPPHSEDSKDPTHLNPYGVRWNRIFKTFP